MKYLALLLLTLSFAFLGESPTLNGQSATQVIEQIIKKTECAGLVDYLAPNLEAGTNDIIKEGDSDIEVTGVITTMFATMEVLQKAVAMDCNLIIAHEPLYYNHFDQTEAFQDDPVFEQKQQFIKDNGLVVWRFHDYIHCLEPDGVMAGMVEKLGWQDKTTNHQLNQFDFQGTTLKKILKQLKKTFPDNAFYVVGDPKMKIKKAELAPGAPGAARHFNILRKPDIDLLIAGEVPQWETYEYVRDAQTQGKNKAVIFLGHVNSEEAGMDYAAKWMRGFIKGLSIHFVESKAPYWTY